LLYDPLEFPPCGGVPHILGLRWLALRNSDAGVRIGQTNRDECRDPNALQNHEQFHLPMMPHQRHEARRPLPMRWTALHPGRQHRLPV
jgi:hypothetical protein